MKPAGVVPGVEYGASLVDHREIWEKIILVGKVLILHGLMEPFNSPVLLGTVGIREVVRDPCIFQLPVKMEKILAPVVGVDGHDGKRKIYHQLLNKVSC